VIYRESEFLAEKAGKRTELLTSIDSDNNSQIADCVMIHPQSMIVKSHVVKGDFEFLIRQKASPNFSLETARVSPEANKTFKSPAEQLVRTYIGYALTGQKAKNNFASTHLSTQ